MPLIIWDAIEGAATILGIGASATAIASSKNSNVNANQLITYAFLAYGVYLLWGKK